MKQLRYCFVVIISFLVLLFIVYRLASSYCNQEIEKTNQKDFSQQIEVSDSQLVEITMNKIQMRYAQYSTEKLMMDRMSEGERIVFCSSIYNNYMKKGSLCDYLSYTQCQAPYLLDSLTKIKAEKYEQSLNIFLVENNINLEDLSEFSVWSNEQYQKNYEKYPFAEFDEYYEEQENEKKLETYIADYIRENLSDQPTN